MSDKENPATVQQPMPYLSPGEPVYKMVLTDVINRSIHGRSIYGGFLTADNGRDNLVDAYQEAIDLVLYLRAEIERRHVNDSN